MRSSLRPGLLDEGAGVGGALPWAPDEIAAAWPEELPDEPVEDPKGDEDHAPLLEDEGSYAEEQDALVEAMALANAERERMEAEERERLIADAYAQGFEEGRVEGEIAEAARLRTALGAAEHALEEIRAGESRWQGAIEENICALAVAIAKQIVGRELQSDPAIVADVVRRAVAEFPVDEPIRIRIHPMDLTTISGPTAGGEAIAIAPDREVSWLADAMVAPGGCVVEGRERIVDGRVDTALERVYRRLTYTNV